MEKRIGAEEILEMARHVLGSLHVEHEKRIESNGLMAREEEGASCTRIGLTGSLE